MTTDLTAIEARHAAATKGPWETREVAHEKTPYSPRRVFRVEIIAPQHYMGRRTHSRDICQIIGYNEWSDHPGNAAFIAHAPEDIAALLVYVGELEAENKRLRGEA